jgi:hypothetical protein
MMTRKALALALLLGAAGCKETTFAMAPNAELPFVKGEVSASVEENGNGSFTVSVEHLGDPGKLNPLAKTYVVWIVPRTGELPSQNVGALKVDSEYSGSYTFTSSFKEFDITITPEERADVSKPSGRDVLKATISMTKSKGKAPAPPPPTAAPAPETPAAEPPAAGPPPAPLPQLPAAPAEEPKPAP